MERSLFRPVVTGFLLVVGLWGAETIARFGLATLEARGVQYRPIRVDDLSASHREALGELLNGRPSLFRHDPVLGWSLSPGFRSELVTVDGQGLRRDPSRPPASASSVRLAVFGDSFTFGGDVHDSDAWPEILARRDSRIDVANYGVPAYGFDQTFLRYQREGRASRGQVVILGFMSENIFRNVSVFRPFYQPLSLLPFAKPRYLPGPAEPTLVPNPMPRLDDYRRLVARPAETLAQLGRHDFFYATRPRGSALDRIAAVRLMKLAVEEMGAGRRSGFYAADSEAFRVTTQIFAAFYEMVLRDGSEPIIVIYPERSDLVRWRAERTKRYAPLLRFLAARGFRVLDAMDAFDSGGRDRSVEDLVPSHYTPFANHLVAGHLLERLRALGLVP